MVCLLSAQGGRELEMWGQGQPCFGPGCHHTHISRDAANKLEHDGVLRYIGKGRNVATYTYGRTWRGVPSGSGGKLAMRTMQLV
jgi:hypothetical protein